MLIFSRQTLGKAFIVMAVSTGVSVLIAASVVPILGGTYDGIGMWMSFCCPMLLAFPFSAWQFHQSEKLRIARDELASLHQHADRMHRELMQVHAALKQKARLDAMTGGLNREAFLGELDRASADGRPGTLLLADADHFKHINDTFGHQTGDEALIAIASAIGATTGVRDLWGRIGGEEFAIFLDGGNPGEAAAVSETIRSAVAAIDIRRERGRVPVTISIGGVDLEGGFNTQQAMSDADRLLYRAKRGGRNRVVLGDLEDDDVSAA